MDIKCSVLVPVYNQEGLVKKCLDSIPKRDDIEIVVVDDCSTDKSLEVLESYGNIKLFHNEINLGIGLTRQKLLDNATGEYIYFLDSDDYVITNTFSFLMDNLNDYDIVESKREMNNGYVYYSKVWNGAFIKSSVAKSTQFKNIRCHEDTVWKDEILKKFPNLKTKKTEYVLYHYNYPREGSLTDIDKHTVKTGIKYVIMCGGSYSEFETPRQLIKVNGEEIVARTIRLLKENHVREDDILISSNNPVFDKFGLIRLTNENNTYTSDGHHPNDVGGFWVDALYPMDEPCCYLFGDVCYSDNAIRIITNTVSDDNIMFGNVPSAPGCRVYIKTWPEPLGFRIVNHEKLRKAQEELKQMWIERDKRLKRHPIAWELYCQMNGLDFIPTFPSSKLPETKNFVNINDYSSDVDHPEEVEDIERYLKYGKVKNAISDRLIYIGLFH